MCADMWPFVWSLCVRVGAGIPGLPERCLSQPQAGLQGFELDGAWGHLCSCLQVSFPSCLPFPHPQVCLRWEMAQVLKQAVLQGGNGDCVCERYQGRAWQPLAASAAGEDTTPGFRLSELSAPGLRCLLNPNEASGSLQCSLLCNGRDRHRSKCCSHTLT